MTFLTMLFELICLFIRNGLSITHFFILVFLMGLMLFDYCVTYPLPLGISRLLLINPLSLNCFLSNLSSVISYACTSTFDCSKLIGLNACRFFDDDATLALGSFTLCTWVST